MYVTVNKPQHPTVL